MDKLFLKISDRCKSFIFVRCKSYPLTCINRTAAYQRSRNFHMPRVLLLEREGKHQRGPSPIQQDQEAKVILLIGFPTSF